MDEFILSIDQGTSSTRSILFDTSGKQRAVHQIALKQYHPQKGWVEHDPQEIWQATQTCCNEVIPKLGITPYDIAAIGITNQRETTVIWDKNTGKPVYHAIVWQDRRTAEYCQQLAKDKRIQQMVRERTGLYLDPYFCASKIRWLLDNVDGLYAAAKSGYVLFGTIDTYLLWNLTQAAVHATDATNASRTLLFNIHTQQWDEELLTIFDIPRSLLPEVKDSAGHFGVTDASLFGAQIPITGMAGDQQASVIGHTCFREGMVKSTYGTGCFIVLNTGEQAVQSTQNLLTTVAYRLNSKVTYALEGSIFIAGAAIQWLRDALHLFATVSETEELANSIETTHGVYFVPAFTGLGAPHWDPMARGAILGLTRDTSIADIVRAALEAVCYQTNDLFSAFHVDYSGNLDTLRVDGGMITNNWLLQFLSDVLNLPVQRSKCVEATALGAAYLAGLGVGLYKSLDDVVKHWQVDRSVNPSMSAQTREKLLAGWDSSIRRVLTN